LRPFSTIPLEAGADNKEESQLFHRKLWETYNIAPKIWLEILLEVTT